MPGAHQIIKETSDSLVQLLTQQFKDSGYKRVHIIVNAPKPDAIEGKLPAVCVYLYQIALDHEGLESHVRDELVQRRKPDGTMEEFRRRAPIWVRLDYLISTWAQNPEDEQLLLGLAVQGIFDHPVISGDKLKGDSFLEYFEKKEEAEVPLVLAGRLDEGTLSRFWGSLNQPVRPAFQVWTSVPVRSEKTEPFLRVRETPGIRYRDLGNRRPEWEYGPKREADLPPPEFRQPPLSTAPVPPKRKV